MADSEDGEKHRRGSFEFTESSVLHTVLPQATYLNIEEALGGPGEGVQEQSPLSAISQRQSLFFDESVTVYVILQTTYFDETTLRSYLARLVVNLEAGVVNAPAENYDGPPPHEVIYNGSVQDTEDPIVIVQGSNGAEDGPEGRIFVVWKMEAALVRPRLRLQNPSIVFTASANLKPAESLDPEAKREEYLTSQVPSGMNLLAAFGDDTSLEGVQPRLSALRVSRVTPLPQSTRDLLQPLKSTSRQSIKIYPAINARVRYSRQNATPNSPIMIASLDIDVTPFTNCEVFLTTVNLKLKGGTAKDLNSAGMALPMACLPQDDVTFLYQLFPDEYEAGIKSQIRNLDISIIATANLSVDCQPDISMRWTTSVDFTPPVNPGFGNPTQPIQRGHRPAQLSISSPADVTSPVSRPGPDALPVMEATTRQLRNPSIPDFGVTMTFTGPSPDDPIHPGTPFIWTVFIVNRSDRPRKLALVTIPKRRRTETRLTRPPSTGGRDRNVAEAVVDENIVHAMQRNAAVDSTELMCLNTDTRVGPLAPLACYEVELRFVALKVGVVGLDAVRVVDLGTQEHVDIKDLPSIVVTRVEEVK